MESIVHHATPSADRLLAVYRYECKTRGKRGALRRAGEMLGCSDETVRRAVIADKARATLFDSLAYEPPPFANREPEPRPIVAPEPAQTATEQAEDPTELPQFATDEDAPAVDDDATPLVENATYQPDEPDVASELPIVWRRQAQRYPQSGSPPGWEYLWTTCAQHMDLVQLIGGVIIVWIIVSIGG